MKTRIISFVVSIAVIGGISSPIIAGAKETLAVISPRPTAMAPRPTASAPHPSASANQLSNPKKVRISNWWKRMFDRLETIILHQQKLANQIELRLKAIDNAGGDVTKARAALAIARTKIQDAEQTLVKANAAVPQILMENNATDAFKKIRALYMDVISKTRESNKALRDVKDMLRKIPTLTRIIPLTPSPIR